MKALIIDDEDDVRSVARLSLARVGGMDVLEADGGRAGVELAATAQPDFVLLDMMMPGMDGASTLEALRAREETRAIRVIFLTAKVTADDIARMRALGALGVIEKPFDPMALAGQVRALLDGNPEP